MITVQEREVQQIIPYARNPRKNEAAIDKVAASLKEFGWRQPIVVDPEMVIIAGHTRLQAAKRLGMTKVPVHVAEGLTDAQIKAYRLADNRTAQEAEWDIDLLALELSDLEGLDLELTGFDLDEIDRYMALADATGEGLTDENEVPEVPEVPTTRPGDVWLLGGHRVMCGDSTDAGQVKILAAGHEADLCFTSPPYSNLRDYKNPITDWTGLLNGVFSALPVKDGAQVLVNLGVVYDKGKVSSYWDEWMQYVESIGWPLFGWYVWDKGYGMPGDWNGRLAPSHEFIFHFARKSTQPNKWVEKQERSREIRPKGKFRQKDGSLKDQTSLQASLQKNKIADSVIRVTPHMARGPETKGHPAVFPVALCENIYNSYAKAGDIVYEPFNGSGTSIIACEKFGAKCFGMDIAPEYVDIAVKRWMDYTGKYAILESTGQEFGEAA